MGERVKGAVSFLSVHYVTRTTYSTYFYILDIENKKNYITHIILRLRKALTRTQTENGRVRFLKLLILFGGRGLTMISNAPYVYDSIMRIPV